MPPTIPYRCHTDQTGPSYSKRIPLASSDHGLPSRSKILPKCSSIRHSPPTTNFVTGAESQNKIATVGMPLSTRRYSHRCMLLICSATARFPAISPRACHIHSEHATRYNAPEQAGYAPKLAYPRPSKGAVLTAKRQAEGGRPTCVMRFQIGRFGLYPRGSAIF